MLHRNSQKRYVIEGAIYFITTNTHDRIEYFNEDILCDLFIEDLRLTQVLKHFNIFSYKINPQHIHVMIQPKGNVTYFEIMRSLKTNFSRNANRVMGYDPNFPPHATLPDANVGSLYHAKAGSLYHAKAGSRDPAFNPMEYSHRIDAYRQRLIAAHGIDSPYPKFKWQSSYHDHIIRNRRDFMAHVNYIKRQWRKHKLSANKYCYIDNDLCSLAFHQIGERLNTYNVAG